MADFQSEHVDTSFIALLANGVVEKVYTINLFRASRLLIKSID